MSENYLIIGNDEFVREQKADTLRKKYLSSGEVDLNLSVYRPDNVEGVMDALETVPLLAERRVVLIRDANALSKGFLENLISYLEKPSDSSVLILSADKSLEENKLYKKLSKVIKVLKADRPDKMSLKNWIRSFLKEQNVEMSRDAVDLLIDLKGDDTQIIKVELDKLVAYSGSGKIDVQHVEELVGRSVTETVFKLVDAINAKDAKWAFRVLGDLYEQKKKPPEIVGYLSWYLRMMQKVVLLSAKGQDVNKIASQLRYSPAYARRLVNQSKKYTSERLGKWVNLLLETDRSIKKGLKEPSLALEMLVAEFVNS